MSRRGRSGPTISLFSFQDIITSVTAVVTVITLLLALDLVKRKQLHSGESSASLGFDLEKRLEIAEVELAELKSAASSVDELVREIASMSPEEMRSDIAQRERRIEDLQRQKRRLENQAETLRSELNKERAQQFDLEPKRNEANQIEESISDLERQLAQERTENRVVFSLPRGAEKSGWIAEINQSKIGVAPIGRPARPTFFGPTGLPLLGASAADNFEKWIDEQRLSSEYFLLLIRPDGKTDFDNVQRLLERRGISHGFDLLGPDEMVLHPERGATF